MPRAAIYCRVSTDEQADSRAGLNAQRDACEAWARREGFEPAGPFEELEGVSGATPLEKREALLAAIDSLGRGDVLLVAKRDRLGRDPILVAMIEAAVERKRCRTVSAAGEGTGSNDPTDVLMRRIVDAFAEYERLIIKARTRAALAAKKRRNERTGKVPFGKALADDGRRSRAGLPIGLVEDHAEQVLIRWFLRLRRDGWTSRRIAWAANHRGLTTKAGKPWTHSTIHFLCRQHAGGPLDGEESPEPQARVEAGPT